MEKVLFSQKNPNYLLTYQINYFIKYFIKKGSAQSPQQPVRIKDWSSKTEWISGSDQKKEHF